MSNNSDCLITTAATAASQDIGSTTSSAFKLGQAVTNYFLQPTSSSASSSTGLSTVTTIQNQIQNQNLDSFSTYADNFDLSLLPQECALSTAIDESNAVYQYSGHTQVQTVVAAKLATSAITPQIKIEQIDDIKEILAHNRCDDLKQNVTAINTTNNIYKQQQQQQRKYQNNPIVKSTKHLIPPPPPYPYAAYPSPQSSPSQSEYCFPQAPFAGSYDSLSSSHSSLYHPSSPCPSLDAATIKQELHILPPSPPESSCETPSPHSNVNLDIKSEPIDAEQEVLIDLKALIDKESLLSRSIPSLSSSLSSSSSQSTFGACISDLKQQEQQQHQLLREYLEDFTFQKKHNLKPLALESFIGDLEEVRNDIEPVISLALEHAKREADETCAKLQISQDPSVWSTTQVHSWLRFTIGQFKLPQIDHLEAKFCENGAALILLSEEEFIRRSPESGSTLHAQLEIWKMAYADNYECNATIQFDSSECLTQDNTTWQQQHQQHHQQQQQQQLDYTNINNEMAMDAEDDSEDEMDILSIGNNLVGNSVAVVASTAIVTTPTSSPSSASATATATSNNIETKRSNGRSGGSHIHLWQFLKELLSTPMANSTAIRWIDRNKGVFKIEDSVRVAKLWGKRKNRPAMNYDKLSRSIRQYYKKGIMKKTERSQRLVYQFCHPYHL